MTTVKSKRAFYVLVAGMVLIALAALGVEVWLLFLFEDEIRALPVMRQIDEALSYKGYTGDQVLFVGAAGVLMGMLTPWLQRVMAKWRLLNKKGE